MDFVQAFDRFYLDLINLLTPVLLKTSDVTNRVDESGRYAMLNVYGDIGKHFIIYPFNAEQVCFAYTFRKPIAEGEFWRTLTNDQALGFIRECGFTQWASPINTFISNTSRWMKVGLYDRSELSTWYEHRVVLVVDAAHSTAPHHIQGTNQVMEDA
ncbi:unnamed protein product [Adineta ricciae]|uniref:FAD-binding domain-containing protein n=1 Tax=Adineta ricciae TaxID=249248 RepID=A0A815TAQ7_ADIRI|nr:unnamed protein product [Adineta ricciae]CAF1503260.1 unnamed protein product [Adineta ricciae]